MGYGRGRAEINTRRGTGYGCRYRRMSLPRRRMKQEGWAASTDEAQITVDCILPMGLNGTMFGTKAGTQGLRMLLRALRPYTL